MKTPVLVLVLGLLVAGCIAPPGESPAGVRSFAGAAMTAKESSEERVELCRDVSLGTAAFCAERTVTVTGDVSGIPAMDVDLETFNGALELEKHDEGGWSLVAVLRARGASEAEARANLDAIGFAWSHTDGSAHFLHARAESPPGRTSAAASLRASLPASIVLTVSAATSNGKIRVEHVRTDGLAATTSNGAVEVDASVTHVDLRTSNGAIEAKLDPTASGRITATTSNGKIELDLPEDARRGYDLDAQTSNGKVTINLRDGESSRRTPSNPYYDPQNEGQFRTTRFESRDVQSLVRMTSSNGAITVDPR